MHCRESIIRTTVIGALIGSLMLGVPALQAADGAIDGGPINDAFIPILGNTALSDLELVMEVNDEHVYNPQQNTPAASQSNTPAPLLINNVWDKIRNSRRLPLTVKHEAVQRQKQRYIKNRRWINLLLRRSEPYLQYIVSRLEVRGLPLDLALLPAIESGFRPEAESPLNATGLWQIVPMTATEIGLKRNIWFDGRADLVQSTRAALDYLSYLNAEFHGDWELTLAAYNAGPGRVKSALRRNAKADISGDFWSLKLPQETRSYVPKLTALLELVRQAPPSTLELPDISAESTLTSVDVGQRISLDRAARLARMPFANLRNLNAGLLHGVTAPEGPHRLLLPDRQVDTFKRNLKALIASTEVSNQGKGENIDLYSVPRTHTVVAGDSVSSIARQYGIVQQRLRELNRISNDKILVGQTLSVLDSRVMTDSAQKNELSYIIQSGDTLSEIALKFNVKLADITFHSGRSATDVVLIPGKKLRIQVRLQVPSKLPVNDGQG